MSGLEKRLHYACPRCGAAMTAAATEAGTRTRCAECGGYAKVPGGGDPAESAPPPLSESLSARRTATPNTVLVACPHCGGSFSVTAGQTPIICPECLEDVPDEAAMPEHDRSVDDLAGDELAGDEFSGDELAGDALAGDDLADDELAGDELAGDELAGDELAGDELAGNELIPLDESFVEEPPSDAPIPLDESPVEQLPEAPISLDERSGEELLGELPGGTGAFQVERPSSPDEFVEEFGLVCGVCGTRLNATLDDVGRTKTCPDCHSPVLVTQPTRTTRRRVAPSEASGEEDEYQIAPPVERTAGYGLDSATLEQLAGESQAHEPGSSPADAWEGELSDAEFSYKCSGCQTRLYASVADLGGKQTCPECGEENTIRRPKPPTFPHAAVDSAGAREAREHWKSETPRRARTEGDDAMERARREFERSEAGVETLEGVPLHRVLLDFFVDIPTLIRLIPLALGTAVLATLLGWAIAWWGDGIGAIISLILGGAAMFVGLAVAISLAVVCQVVVGDTANGNRRVCNWPDGLITDWWVDSLFILTSLFFSALPGVLLGQLPRTLGAPLWLLIFLALGSIWVLFPPTLLSVLETGSPVTPISPPIWKSLVSASGKWLRFYGLSAGLALLIFLELLMFLPGWIVLNPLVAVLLTATVVIYARLLGYHAWSCQDDFWPEETAEQPPESEKTRVQL